MFHFTEVSVDLQYLSIVALQIEENTSLAIKSHDKWNQIVVLMTRHKAEHPVSDTSLKAE